MTGSENAGDVSVGQLNEIMDGWDVGMSVSRFLRSWGSTMKANRDSWEKQGRLVVMHPSGYMMPTTFCDEGDPEPDPDRIVIALIVPSTDDPEDVKSWRHNEG